MELNGLMPSLTEYVRMPRNVTGNQLLHLESTNCNNNNNNNVLYFNKETIRNYVMTLCFQFKVTIRTPKEASGRLV